MAEQSISYNADGAADGGGGRSITQPFSPGDTGGKVGKGGSKNSLARFLNKQGVGRVVAQKVGELSVSLFANMDLEGLHHFAGDDPMDRAIMRAAQASLKGELASEEAESGLKRSRALFENEEEEEEEEEGMDALVKASGQRQMEDLRRRALASGRQPRSEVSIVYDDPYNIGEDSEGKNYILNIYGNQSSAGTVYARRMASLRYNETAPKGSVILRIPQLNVALISANKADTVKRSEAIAVILLTVHQSRWGCLFQNDWDVDPEIFQRKAFQHWSIELEERTIVGWTGIDKLKLAEGTAPLRSVETLSSLLTFKWTVIEGLRLSMFEHHKGESRSLKGTPCNNHNEGVATVIRRLNNLMMAFMSMSYDRVFASFIQFITEDDKAATMGGDQIAFNFNSAMMKVGNAVSSVTDMKLGNGSELSIRGPHEVSVAITAAMEYQIGMMRSREHMRNQKEDFPALMARQANRAQGGAGGKPASRDVAQGSIDESDDIVRQTQLPDGKKQGRGGKAAKKEVDKGESKIPNKCNFLCVGYLGESLGAMSGGQQSRCIKGEEKCYFVHRKASLITRIEAEEAMKKPVDSEMNKAIKKKIAEFTEFKK